MAAITMDGISMSSSSSVRVAQVETSISNLMPDVLEELGMRLNPRLPLKDVRTLGGKMGYTFMRMKNFELQSNPTIALLEDWWTEHGKKGEMKTVIELIQLLSDMRRDDAVDLLKPYEYSDIVLPPPKPAKGYPPQAPRSSTSPFGGYSRRDVQETKPGVENDFVINVNLPYNHTPEAAIISGVQNTIEHSITPNNGQTMSPNETGNRVVGRHPATLELYNGQHGQRTNTNLRREAETPAVKIANERTPRAVGVTLANHPQSIRRPVVADKVALVIGNQDYMCEKLRGLYYPMTDTADVATALWKLGFKVVSLVNLTLSEMRIAVLSFCRLLGKGVYGVLYYGGHGYEDGGENFLLPTDANLKYDRKDSLCAQEILQSMQDCNTSLNLLIIDSCRIRLPERGKRPTYVKRLPTGNNIFAYSCCSQQEAYEEPNQRNGLYAHHLLKHINRDVRIELILMDVATGVTLANNRHFSQRPCHESDAVNDCRLTDPIQPEALPYEFRERVELWQKAHTLTEPFRVFQKDGLILDFKLKANFSNVLEVMMVAYNTTQHAMNRFVMDLSVPTPVQSQVIMLSSETLLPNSVLRQVVRLSALQKLQDKLVAVIKVFYDLDGRRADVEQEVNLGCPLVSSVFTEWDWWITCGRLPPTKTTQV